MPQSQNFQHQFFANASCKYLSSKKIGSENISFPSYRSPSSHPKDTKVFGNILGTIPC